MCVLYETKSLIKIADPLGGFETPYPKKDFRYLAGVMPIHLRNCLMK